MVSSSNSNNINNNSTQTEDKITEEEIDEILNRPTTTQSESNEIIEDDDEYDEFDDLILNRRFIITSQLDEYKKEYNYIMKINKQFKKLLNRLDDIDNGIFNSELAFKICKLIKKFLRRQEKGKFKDISNFEIYEDDVNYLIEIKEKFYCYKLRYDALIMTIILILGLKEFIAILNYFLISLILFMKIVIAIVIVIVIERNLILIILKVIGKIFGINFKIK